MLTQTNWPYYPATLILRTRDLKIQPSWRGPRTPTSTYVTVKHAHYSHADYGIFHHSYSWNQNYSYICLFLESASRSTPVHLILLHSPGYIYRLPPSPYRNLHLISNCPRFISLNHDFLPQYQPLASQCFPSFEPSRAASNPPWMHLDRIRHWVCS